MTLFVIPNELINSIMLYFTLSDLVMFANTSQDLKKLLENVPFKDIYLNSCQGESLNWLLYYVGRVPLEYLSLRGTAFTNACLGFIKTPLRALHLDTTGITLNALGLIDCSALEDLYLTECTVSVRSLSCLNKTRLNTLSFVGCVLEEDVLSFLQEFPNLENLSLGYIDINDADVSLIGNNLKFLSLIEMKGITDNSVEVLSNLPLTGLYFPCCSITPQGVAILRERMLDCSFERLSRNRDVRKTPKLCFVDRNNLY